MNTVLINENVEPAINKNGTNYIFIQDDDSVAEFVNNCVNVIIEHMLSDPICFKPHEVIAVSVPSKDYGMKLAAKLKTYDLDAIYGCSSYKKHVSKQLFYTQDERSVQYKIMAMKLAMLLKRIISTSKSLGRHELERIRSEIETLINRILNLPAEDDGVLSDKQSAKRHLDKNFSNKVFIGLMEGAAKKLSPRNLGNEIALIQKNHEDVWRHFCNYFSEYAHNPSDGSENLTEGANAQNIEFLLSALDFSEWESINPRADIKMIIKPSVLVFHHKSLKDAIEGSENLVKIICIKRGSN